MNSGKESPMHKGDQGEWVEKLRSATDTSAEAQASLQALAHDLLSGSSQGEWGEREEALLDYLADQARRGKDLAKAHPEAFQLLLSNAALREAFLELIDSIEDEGGLSAPYTLGEIDLSFLKDSGAPARVEQTSSSNWQIVWQWGAEELRKLFVPSELAYRGQTAFPHNAWLPVLRGDINLDDRFSVAVGLEIAPSKAIDHLDLFVSVAPHLRTDESSTKQFSFRVGLAWGDYAEEIEIGEAYRAQLPPVPISNIGNDQTITQGLSLTVQVSQLE